MVLKAVYSSSAVCLSFGIAFLGSYLTISFCELLRRALSTVLPPKMMGKWSLMGAMALSLGGIGIWCMHFVGMASLTLYHDGDEVLISYTLCPTLISMIVCIIFAGSGLYIASLDPMFGKSRHEIVETFVKEASKLSLKDVMHISHFKMLRIISTQSLGYLVTGGLISGAGVSVMHYLGMWAMEFENGVIVWHAGIVTASVLIAIIASIVAFWILFRLLSLYPQLEILRLISAFLMAVAVTAMHFTGMMAATFAYRPGKVSTMSTGAMKTAITSENAFFGVKIAALVLGTILVILAFSEHRHRMYQLTAELKRYQDGVAALQKRDNTAPVSLTVDSYLHHLVHAPRSNNATMRKVTATVSTVKENVIVPFTVEDIESTTSEGVDLEDQLAVTRLKNKQVPASMVGGKAAERYMEVVNEEPAV